MSFAKAKWGWCLCAVFYFEINTKLETAKPGVSQVISYFDFDFARAAVKFTPLPICLPFYWVIGDRKSRKEMKADVWFGKDVFKGIEDDEDLEEADVEAAIKSIKKKGGKIPEKAQKKATSESKKEAKKGQGSEKATAASTNLNEEHDESSSSSEESSSSSESDSDFDENEHYPYR